MNQYPIHCFDGEYVMTAATPCYRNLAFIGSDVAFVNVVCFGEGCCLPPGGVLKIGLDIILLEVHNHISATQTKYFYGHLAPHAPTYARDHVTSSDNLYTDKCVLWLSSSFLSQRRHGRYLFF